MEEETEGTAAASEKSDKNFMVCLILMIIPLCCMLGVDRFYSGNIVKGLIRWIPIVGWIFGIIDLVALIQGKYLDGEGKVVSKD